VAPAPPSAARGDAQGAHPAVDPGGSEVLAVDPDEQSTNVSVMQLAGERAGASVAVVWINDEPDPGSSPVE
jgi:hypothetical protein